MTAEAVALILFTGVVLYACFGGADFGVGIWDLTAGNARKGAAMRSLIDRSLGPVWEANHTWLIFVLVYLWTGFPLAFASICQTLWIPLSLAGLGIVFRGAAFVFRKFAPTLGIARLCGALFAASSIITPFFMGTIAGAIASSKVSPVEVGDAWASWTGSASLIGGTIAVLTCAFLAAVFLTYEAARDNDESLLRACQRRAIASGIVTGIAALALLAPLEHAAPTLFDRLTSTALPFVLLSTLAGVATLATLATRRFGIARACALGAVASVVLGWGVAQYPDIVTDQITIDQAAGADATLVALIAVFGITLVTVLPALIYLYWITQRPSWLDPKKRPASPSMASSVAE